MESRASPCPAERRSPTEGPVRSSPEDMQFRFLTTVVPWVNVPSVPGLPRPPSELNHLMAAASKIVAYGAGTDGSHRDLAEEARIRFEGQSWHCLRVARPLFSAASQQQLYGIPASHIGRDVNRAPPSARFLNSIRSRPSVMKAGALVEWQGVDLGGKAPLQSRLQGDLAGKEKCPHLLDSIGRGGPI
jgi:hypothetical protein